MIGIERSLDSNGAGERVIRPSVLVSTRSFKPAFSYWSWVTARLRTI